MKKISLCNQISGLMILAVVLTVLNAATPVRASVAEPAGLGDFSQASQIVPLSNPTFFPFAPEYVVTGSEGQNAWYFPSNGDGTFGAKSLVIGPRVVDGIAIADFDNDGDLDFVLGDGNTDSIILYRNDGSGLYTPITIATSVLGATPFFRQFRAADFNGDGKMDFTAGGFTTGSSKQFVFLNQGGNTFTKLSLDITWRGGSPVFGADVGDYNGDGKVDILIAGLYGGATTGQVGLYKGNGDGTFQTPVLVINILTDKSVPNPIGLASSDFNGDGKLDVLIGCELSTVKNGLVYLYLGNGLGGFTLQTGPGTDGSVFNVLDGVTIGQCGLDAFDFDKDGKIDVVADNWNGGKLFFFRGNGDGTFAPRVTVDSAIGASVGIAAPPDVTPPKVEGRMTGGGSVFNASMRVTHGFTLSSNISKESNNLQVNWGKGNKFHLENLTSATLSDNPAIMPDPPVAGFDTYEGTGTGSYNGMPGSAHWIFTDAGEPGKSDTALIHVWNNPTMSGAPVLSVSGNLTNGNQQAHKE